MATTLTGTSITTGTSAPASPNVSDMWFDTTSGIDAMKVYNGTEFERMSNNFTATGGTITESGGYTIHTFTSSGTFTPNSNGSVDYLIVAGGGGAAAGGGGAGGFLSAAGHSVSNQAYSIVIGAGGAGISNNASVGPNGGVSSGLGITASGGGGGGKFSNAGNGTANAGAGANDGGAKRCAELEEDPT